MCLFNGQTFDPPYHHSIDPLTNAISNADIGPVTPRNIIQFAETTNL